MEIVEIKARLKSPESMFTKLGKDVEGEAFDIQDILAVTFILRNRDDTLKLFHALQKRGVILQENTASHSITQTLFDSPEAMIEAVRRLILSLSRSEGIDEMRDEHELHDHAKKFYEALSVHGVKNLHSSSGHRKFQCKIAFSLPIHRTAKANLIMIPGMPIYLRRDQVTKKTQQHTLWVDKALGQEWGRSKGVSDVTYETWAWDRGKYFEIHIRMTHTGQDIHTLADAESPAAYFGAALPIEYGYTVTGPFRAEEIQQYHMVTGNMSNNTNPPVYPSENWMAFGDRQGNGLILAVPPQPKLSGQWSMVYIQYAYPKPIGYLSPFAHLETSPGFVFDLTYYLIPGPIQDNRSIVYNLIPHTTWTFNLNSSEGWTSTSQLIEAQNGVVSASLSPGPGYNLGGDQTLDLLAKDIVSFTGKYTPDILRKDKNAPASGYTDLTDMIGAYRNWING